MGAVLNSLVGGPGPLNAVTEDPPGICGGGQSGMAQTVSAPPPPTHTHTPASVGAQGRLTSKSGGPHNGLQAPSASHLGPIQLSSRLVGKIFPFRFDSSTGWGEGGGVSSHHPALGFRTRTATEKRSGSFLEGRAEPPPLFRYL